MQLDVLIKDLLAMDLAGSKVKLVLDVPNDSYLVDADRGQMEQVFSNLVINAVQAMKSGGRLFISVAREDFATQQLGLHAGKYVHVTIQDEGEGISEENIELIFDPYFSTKATGNGLGLATVYSIISRHEGRINVSSQVGSGTTFDIYLPASSGSMPEGVESEFHSSDAGPMSGRILILDDEPLLCELACKILEKEGFDVDIAHSGREAVERYRQALAENSLYL